MMHLPMVTRDITFMYLLDGYRLMAHDAPAYGNMRHNFHVPLGWQQTYGPWWACTWWCVPAAWAERMTARGGCPALQHTHINMSPALSIHLRVKSEQSTCGICTVNLWNLNSQPLKCEQSTCRISTVNLELWTVNLCNLNSLWNLTSQPVESGQSIWNTQSTFEIWTVNLWKLINLAVNLDSQPVESG